MSDKPIAMISGAYGQDAHYLSSLLLSKGYTVIAFARRIGQRDCSNIQDFLSNDNYILESGDITDSGSINHLIAKYRPNEFYNLAAMSHVHESWKQPVATNEINFLGVLYCLEAIRTIAPETKFFQASTSEVLGDVITDVQDEMSPLRPRSPYAAAKAGSEHLVKVYRDSYNIFACFARSYNHESVLRPVEFVTRKITSGIASQFSVVDNYIANLPKKDGTLYIPAQDAFDHCFQSELFKPIVLGNLEARRDWSHAKDVVEGIYLMLQQDNPDDYVLASGETRSIKDFLTTSYGIVGVIDWSKFVKTDEKFVRPAEVSLLLGNASKAKEKLGWSPKISFEELVEEMLWHDINIQTSKITGHKECQTV